MTWRKLISASVLALAALAGCSKEPENDGSMRGTLAVSVAAMRDGTSQKVFRLVLDESERDERRLVFAKEPELAPGSEIKVWGELDGNDILVRRFDVLDDDVRNVTGRAVEPLIDAPANPNRTVGVVLVSSDGLATDYPLSRANTDYFGLGSTDRSLKQWFGEASYGVQGITGAVASIAEPFEDCSTTPGTDQFESQANVALGMTPDHYVWILLDSVNCMYDGVGNLGTVSNPARDSWIYGPFNMDGGAGCTLRAHGPLFNMGHLLSTSLRCGSESFPNDPSQLCSERVDPDDVMGSVDCRHLSATGKQYQGWFGGCNSVRVNQSGVYTLFPAEIECNGIQVLQVPMPTVGLPTGGRVLTTINGPRPVEFYFLELRTNTGFDAGPGRNPKVIVRVGRDYGPRAMAPRSTWMLDMDPASARLGDGMTAGQTFTDPAGGVAFTVQALSNASATVSVTVPTSAPNTCAGGGTITAPGPATCTSGAGGMGGAGGMAGAGGASGGVGGVSGAGVGGGGVGGVGGASGAGAGGSGLGGIGGMAGAGAGGAAGGGEDAGAGGDGEGGSNGGSAGNAGESGTGGTSGSAGASTGGAATGGAGSGGATTGGTSSAGENGDDAAATNDSGCGCRIGKAPLRRDAALAIGLLGILAVRRRRSRQHAS